MKLGGWGCGEDLGYGAEKDMAPARARPALVQCSHSSSPVFIQFPCEESPAVSLEPWKHYILYAQWLSDLCFDKDPMNGCTLGGFFFNDVAFFFF